tara:strand:+ start:1551 stop:1703 length:153 start_codon:yes stop_codon:yes gene_type:complete
MYEIFTSATGTMATTYPTLKEAIVAAKKLGYPAHIFKSGDPFTIIKSIGG